MWQQMHNESKNAIAQVFQALEKKGYLAHEPKGRGFVYRPIVDKQAYGRGRLSSVINRFFSDSYMSVVLLAILVVSPLLPLIPLHTDEPTTFDGVLTKIEGPLLSLSTSENDTDATLAAQEDENVASGLWVRYLAYIYIIGIAVALAVYMCRLLTLTRVMRRSRRISHPIVPKDVRLMLDMRIKQPSSWMHWIFIGPIDLKQNADAVLRHELAHVRLGHSWDVLLCDLTCRLLWCLPFAWMLRGDLVDVHEFQADEAVLQGGVTLEDYERLLVRKAVQTQFLPIMNTLRRGAVKKRFAMMYSGRSSRWSRLKLLYLVPALAACLWVSAKAEEYKTYLNGKLVTQEDLQAIDSNTIEHVDVLKSQKTIYIETSDTPEQMPQFPGGDAAMQQYISRHIRYPKAAIESGVEGTLIAEFTVEADGSITNVNASGPSSSTDKSNIVVTAYRPSSVSASGKDEGIRALQEFTEELIRGMPPFEPGRQQGNAVPTKVTLPITYQLN
ncbi:MAG: energy transducer TonB [Bacteroidaceae bacterium]|nr:energy transducer TonB [Bacteroidaceae bacterium]